MALRFAEHAAEAYRFPLTIGHLLDAARATSADREIVYRNQVRLSYRQLRERIGRLASLLAGLGAHEGMTVAVMDWDSHRYLEAYFAVPICAADEYETLIGAADPYFPFRDFDENAMATTFYTTGTTGEPKGVCFSHRQIVLLALAAKAPFGVAQPWNGVDQRLRNV